MKKYGRSGADLPFRKLVNSVRARLRLSTVLFASIAASFTIGPGANARDTDDEQISQIILEQALRKRSPEALIAFISSFPEEKERQLEARVRAINLLGQFGDLHLSEPTFTNEDLSRNSVAQPTIRLASNSDADTYVPPYGTRRYTYKDIFVDHSGNVVNKHGQCVTPYGAVTELPYRVTPDNKLRSPSGAIVSDDVAIRQGGLSQDQNLRRVSWPPDKRNS